MRVSGKVAELLKDHTIGPYWRWLENRGLGSVTHWFGTSPSCFTPVITLSEEVAIVSSYLLVYVDAKLSHCHEFG